MVTAAQTAKAPFIRMVDRYALLLLPVTLVVAGAAWCLTRSHSRARCGCRGDAMSVHPGCAGRLYRRRRAGRPPRHLDQRRRASRDARPRTHGDVRQDGHSDCWRSPPVAVETAPGEDPDEALRLAASLEQASQHVVAAAIVALRWIRASLCRFRRRCARPWGPGSRASSTGEGLRRFASACLWRRAARRVGGQSATAGLLALRPQRFRFSGRAHDRRFAASGRTAP